MNGTDIYNPTLDKINGSAISGILLTGILGNSFCIYYFLSSASRNTNAEFFRRLYSVISLVDFLVTINSVPVVEASFRRGRNGAMFANTEFCITWSCLWSLLSIMSVFLVGMLSVARLIILKYPCIRLKPVLAWTIPAVVAIGWLAVLGILNATGFILFSNRKDYLACTFYPIEDISDVQNTHIMSRKVQLSTITVLLLRVILPSAVFIIVLTSFIITLYILKKKCSTRTSNGPRTPQQAAITVVLVTFVYLICNLITVVIPVAVFLKSLQAIQKMTPQGIPISSFFGQVKLLQPEVYTNLFPFMMVYSVTINSTVNPFVYVTRMAMFRAFVWECKDKAARTISRMRTMILAAPADDLSTEAEQPGTLNNLMERPWSFIWEPVSGNGDARALNLRISSIREETMSIERGTRVGRSSSVKGRQFVSLNASKAVRSRSLSTRRKLVDGSYI